MEVKRKARAGTNEKSDIYVEVSPEKGGIYIELESTVGRCFGENIEATIKKAVEQSGVRDARIKAIDKGALDYVIEARMETVLKRACR